MEKMTRLQAFQKAYARASKKTSVQPSCLIALSAAFPEALSLSVERIHEVLWTARVFLPDGAYPEGSEWHTAEWHTVTGSTAHVAAETLVELFGR